MPVVRVLSLVLALLVCAWFALGVRQADDTSQATAIVARGPDVSSAEAAHADSLLQAAGTLNPDSQVDLLRAQVALIEKRRDRALRILEDVVRREPTNLLGWQLLTLASQNVPELARVAARIAELDPRVVSRRR
jgi:predicted Zn-dependent protease